MPNRRPIRRTPLTGTAAKLQNFTVRLHGIDQDFFVLATSRSAAYQAALRAAGCKPNETPIAESVAVRTAPIGATLGSK